MKFSVLMSVYKKEKKSNLIECFESLLNQTLKADEWVIVKDGPLTPELDETIDVYQAKNPGLIKIVVLDKNVGLGLALREGVKNCSNKYIARMDTDDISLPDRFEKQVKFMEKNYDIDISGGFIEEFEGNIENVISKREVPLKHLDIVKYQKTRSAFNHATVFFKKEAVLSSGNYEDAPLMEDDMLWTRMILSHKKMANIGETLVYVRVGSDMINRRGGFSYFKKYKKARKKIYKLGFISYFDYKKTIIIQFIVALVPTPIRKLIFFKFLRKPGVSSNGKV